MSRLYPEKVDPRTLSPLTLAFIGDGVFELLVRERLVCEGNRPAGALHKRSVAMVRAEAQAEAMDRLLPLLTETEAAVYRGPQRPHFPQQRGISQGHRPGGAVRLSLSAGRYRTAAGVISADNGG